MATFHDVPENHPQHTEIEWLAAQGLTRGYSDGSFRPGQPVTRAEVATFLYRYDTGTKVTPTPQPEPEPEPTPDPEPAPAPDDTNPTGGSGGGSLRDAQAQTYSNGEETSQWHMWAAHLASKPGPHPVILALHGDGGYWYQNPTYGGSGQLISLAREKNAMLILPRTPDRTGSITWWEDASSGRWAADLLDYVGRYHNLDLNRVYIIGYSGGAEVTSYQLMRYHSDGWTGGGAILTGGGGAYTFSPRPTLSQSLRDRFPMHWVVGVNDLGQRNGFNAVNASRRGSTYWASQGIDTELTIVPGRDHYNITPDAVAALERMIDRR